MLCIWIIIMSLINGFCGGSVYSQCSCYTFDGRLKNWKYGRDDCRTQGGDLVSMETVEEWEFLKTQIQNRTSGIFDEWWIGLHKRDGEWTWLSNHPLTYDKWQPYNPRVQQYKNRVVMSRNYPVNTYGLFSNVEMFLWKGWICEIKTKECSDLEAVQCCNSSVTPRPMTVSNADQATTTDNELYISSSTTTKSNNDYSVAVQYPHPKYYTGMSKTDDVTTTTTDVSLTSKKKPSSTLTIIIVVVVVGVVMVLCCVMLCVYRWKQKQIEKPKPRHTYHVTNNGHNNSGFFAGSFSGLQPNYACAQEHSHPTAHGYPNSYPVIEVPRIHSQDCLVPPMIYDALELGDYSNTVSLESAGKDSNHNKSNTEIRNPSGRNSSQEHVDSQGQSEAVEKNKVSDIYATVDKSKKTNKAAITEVVYAQVNKRSKKSMKHDLVTYANLDGFNHDAAQNTAPMAAPPYHPTEYAYASNK